MLATTPSLTPDFATLIGASDAIVAVRTLVYRLAGTDASVLVTGPAGSGKAVVAKLLHERGGRAARPFVAVNCAAIRRDRLDSEIFGLEAGDDAGLNPPRRGRFEAADGGTVFLDELGHMPLDVQAKLHRALTTRAIEPAGGPAPVPVDVRVVAATRFDLGAAVAGRRFDANLFDRLTIIALPALADRRDDIPLLIDFFAALEGGRCARPLFAADALAYLCRQPWPGNVRELRSFVTRAAAARGVSPIDEARAAVLLHGERRAVDRWLDSSPAPLPLPNRRRPPPFVAANEVADFRVLLSDFEQACLRDALGRAALYTPRLLGVPWAALVERMRRLNSARRRSHRASA